MPSAGALSAEAVATVSHRQQDVGRVSHRQQDVARVSRRQRSVEREALPELEQLFVGCAQELSSSAGQRGRQRALTLLEAGGGERSTREAALLAFATKCLPLSRLNLPQLRTSSAS
jgi:hypothetical protein